MTSEKNTEENELEYAEDSSWYKFLLASIELDKGDDGARGAKPDGWHWFWGIYGLHRKVSIFPKFNIDEIEKQLPNNRCINFNPYEEEQLPHPEMMFAYDMQKEATNALHKLLQESNYLETFKKIDFSKLVFEHEVNFSNLIFPVPVSFEKAEFAGDVHFNDAVFCVNTCFDETIFNNKPQFKKTVFFHNVSFASTHFIDGVSFQGAEFFVDINFDNTIFPTDVDFSKTKFFRCASFIDAKFPEYANFLGANFSLIANFSKTKFLGDTDFSTATFSGITNFTDTKFSNATSFNEVSFLWTTDFSNAVFSNRAHFGSATFSKNANFINTTFAETANFKDAKFAGTVFFESVKFSKDANFTEAVFSDTVIMKGTKFHGETYFEETKFSDDAGFENTCFCGTVSFKDAIFSGKATFTNAEFFDEIKFDWAKFKDFTNFINTEFKKYVPSFNKAEFHSNTSWSWKVVLWPQVGNHKRYQADKDHRTRIANNQNAYENLSSQMKGLDKYHDEHFFYRQEMRCRRRRSSRTARFFYCLYEWFSDYGYGIKQAFYWWLGHILAGIFFLMIIIRINIDGGQHKDLELAKGFGCSITTSFSNAHRFLSFHNGALSDCHNYLEKLYLFDVIWALQTIFGILFLFLFLLTVRIRFRLK